MYIWSSLLPNLLASLFQCISSCIFYLVHCSQFELQRSSRFSDETYLLTLLYLYTFFIITPPVCHGNLAIILQTGVNGNVLICSLYKNLNVHCVLNVNSHVYHCIVCTSFVHQVMDLFYLTTVESDTKCLHISYV